MKLYNQITGEWSGYIPGGIVNDFSHGYKSELLVPSQKEEPIRKKEVASMLRDFIDRNPDRTEEVRREWGDVITL